MIDIEQLPPEMREKVLKEIEEHGEWMTSYSLYMAPLWKMIDALQATDTDIVWMSTAFHMINFFSSKDPTPLHFVVAREKLKDKEEETERAADMLARELVNYCQAFQRQITNLFSIKETALIPLLMYQDGGFLIPSRNFLPGFICEREGCNSFDLLLCDFLEGIGDTGRNAAKEIREDSKNRHRIFKDSGYLAELRPKNWNLWFNKRGGRTTLFSPFLSILADVIWEDKIRQKENRQRTLHPAIATSIWSDTLKPALKRNSKVEAKGDRISAISEQGKVVAYAKMSYIDEKLLSLICRGLKSLGSLSGHRLLRWEIKSGCQNIINEKPDPRLLIASGGYEGIAKLIGCSNNTKQITEVRAILQAQAHCQFQFPNGVKVSSLIMLEEIGYHRNKEPNKIKIILGDILLPQIIFQLPKGSQQLLIPFPVDFPPLVGSPNTYAAQAMLQLLILDEFSKQSKRLVEKGSVLIPIGKWEELSQEASLPPSNLNRVISGWTSNDLPETAFLQKDGEEYTLAKAYADILIFLKDQGSRRIAASEAGKKSAQLAAAKKKRVHGGSKIKGT